MKKTLHFRFVLAVSLLSACVHANAQTSSSEVNAARGLLRKATASKEADSAGSSN